MTPPNPFTYAGESRRFTHRVFKRSLPSNPVGTQGTRPTVKRLEMKTGMKGIERPRILFIDCYDSFSNNIIALLHESLTTVDQQPIIEKISNDERPYWPLNDYSRFLFQRFLAGFDAVVAGPGPGNPANSNDVGLISTLWSLPETFERPVLGICLGFQSMCLDAGASVVRLPQGRHGIVTELDHCNRSIVSGIGRLQTTHYHSLHVNIDHPMQTGIGFESPAQMWQSSLSVPRVVPLAWDCNPPQDISNVRREQESVKPYKGGILMAAEVRGKPWWGVQYHPESICSGKVEAKLLIANWWKVAKGWLASHKQQFIEPAVSNSLEAAMQCNKRYRPEDEVPYLVAGRLQDQQLLVDDAEPVRKRIMLEMDHIESSRQEPESSRTSSTEPNSTGHSSFAAGPSSETVGHDCKHIPSKDGNVRVAPSTFAGLGAPDTPNALSIVHDSNAPDDLDSERGEDPPDTEDEDEDDDDSDSGADDEPTRVGTVRQVPAQYGGFSYSPNVVSRKLHVNEMAREQIVQHVQDIVNSDSAECLLLESGQSRANQARSTGRFSILGITAMDTVKICYFSATHTVHIIRNTEDRPTVISGISDFGAYWKGLKQHFHADGGEESPPFWGGSFSIYGYEACLSMGQIPQFRNDNLPAGDRPDVIATIVLRSIVIDHAYHDMWIQSIAPGDEPWVREATRSLKWGLINPALLINLQEQEDHEEQLLSSEISTSCDVLLSDPKSAPANLRFGGIYKGPSKASYEEKVRRCQSYIADGDSYELCLTAQTVVNLPRTCFSRQRDEVLYRNLTRHNPAPFGARIRLKLGQTGLTIFSSSPERFLSWDRGMKCEFRPIKGTLRKREGMTLQHAVEYFKSTKERAENLMITDLIRHDLNGVLQSPNSVRVPEDKLFAVEEYSTVYQLVTVIEGRFRNTNKTGVDVLNASLPPGSMTGAPKKRSCELLQQIEEYEPRGLYSGVIGYDDVGGGGDFSVLIRAALRWDGDVDKSIDVEGRIQEYERWNIGAGGAVTALSDPTDEYNEMLTKRSAVLQAFSALPGRFSERS